MKSRLFDSASLLVCSALVAAAGKMAFNTFGIILTFGFAFLWSLIFVVAIYLMLINKKIALITLASVVIVAFLVFLRLDEKAKETIFDFFGKSFEFLKSGGEIPLEYVRTLGLFVLFAFSLVLILPAIIFPFFPALFAICLTLVLFQWEKNNISMLYETSIIFGALIVFFARSLQINEGSKTKQIRNVSSAWLVPFAAVIMLSVAGIAQNSDLDKKWEWLEIRTNIIGDYFSEIAGNTIPRTIFDISKVGYQPLGGRLGGPVDLDDTEIMKVRTRYQLLLRGSIKNTYTGSSWLDDSVSYRSRLINKFKEAQISAFNLDMPSETLKENLYFDYVDTFIIPSTDSSATIFSPFRMVDIKPQKALTMLISFNTEGEVFASRDIGAGISYTVKSEYIKYGTQGFKEYVLEVQSALNDEDIVLDELIELNYTQKFEAVPQNIEVLAGEITLGIENDYLKALAIKEYLEDGFAYTLTPDVPPEDADFVEYFLETKKGYCTYFASAMAVLSRSAGLPSRYVEGFKVPEGPSGRNRPITGENAHAWAEIYIEGFGWLPFDPQTSGQTTASDTPLELPEEDIIEEEIPELDIPEEEFEETSKSLPYIIITAIILCLILAASLLLAASKFRINLRKVKRQSKNANQAIMFYYKEIMLLMAYLKYEKPIGHTLNSYAEGVDNRIMLAGHSFKDVALTASKILYAKKELGNKDLQSVYEYHRALLKYIRTRLGVIRYFVIMFKGLFMKSLHRSGTPF